ncbi:hypothetical protein ABUP60_00040 [Acinetobacter baumannii]
MASWGSYVFELCRINANQGWTAETTGITLSESALPATLIGLVVRGAKTVVVRGKPNFDPKPQKT